MTWFTASPLGIGSAETLRNWYRQAEDAGTRPRVSSDESRSCASCGPTWKECPPTSFTCASDCRKTNASPISSSLASNQMDFGWVNSAKPSAPARQRPSAYEAAWKRSAGKDAGIGAVAALVTPVGLVAGLVGGGLLGSLHHKNLGLDNADCREATCALALSQLTHGSTQNQHLPPAQGCRSDGAAESGAPQAPSPRIWLPDRAS
jgi:hypothetical protein